MDALSREEFIIILINHRLSTISEFGVGMGLVVKFKVQKGRTIEVIWPRASTASSMYESDIIQGLK